MPKISVIMPAYNAEKYIAEAIDSILGQTFSDFELIILNDFSADATEELILSYRDPRIVYLKNEQNLGVAATLNRGLALAKGAYIARMDADDIALPERFARQTELLDGTPDIAAVGCAIALFDETGVIDVRRFSTDPAQMNVDLFFSCGLAHPSVMMRKSVIDALGGYDPAFEGLEDYELWCRVSKNHGVTTLPEVLFRYRVHGGQVTKNPSEKYLTRLRALKGRQLAELDLKPSDCYLDLCQDQRPKTQEEILTAAAFFETVLEANRRACRYDPALLADSFRSILLSAAAALTAAERNAVCRRTPLIDPGSLAKYRLKNGLRRLLGR